MSSAQLSEGAYFFISYLYPGSGFPSTFLCFLLSSCKMSLPNSGSDLRRSTDDFSVYSGFIDNCFLMKAFISVSYLSIKTVFSRVFIHSIIYHLPCAKHCSKCWRYCREQNRGLKKKKKKSSASETHFS